MIYFIQEGYYDGPVKIGYTGRDPYIRLKEIQRDYSEILSIICCMPGSEIDERRIHKHLKEHRQDGEWFEWCPKLEGIIQEFENATELVIASHESEEADTDISSEETVYGRNKMVIMQDFIGELMQPRFDKAYTLAKLLLENDSDFPNDCLRNGVAQTLKELANAGDALRDFAEKLDRGEIGDYDEYVEKYGAVFIRGLPDSER